MKNNKKAWDIIYREKGKYFEDIHPDILKVSKLLKKLKARKVLDLGSGTGRNTVFLARNGFEVYGIDISEKGITETKDWLKKEDLSAHLSTQDITKKLPFESDFFDAVISTQVIHHARIKTIEKIIKEIGRVLNTNGFVLVTAPEDRGYDPERRGGWKMKLIEKHTYLPLSGPEKGLVHYFFTKETLRDAFSKFFVIKKLYIDQTNHLSVWGTKKLRK